jgi:hypothetical protein
MCETKRDLDFGFESARELTVGSVIRVEAFDRHQPVHAAAGVEDRAIHFRETSLGDPVQ